VRYKKGRRHRGAKAQRGITEALALWRFGTLALNYIKGEKIMNEERNPNSAGMEEEDDTPGRKVSSPFPWGKRSTVWKSVM